MPDDALPELPRVRAPELPETLDWIGADALRPRLADLRGRAVLLDFWSYGCINCIHLVPQLHELQRRFPRELVVLGVHAGKHPAERVTARIRDAMARLGVAHPVLNDRQFRVWRAFAVDAWPTLVLVDPQGYVVGSRGGERTADELTPVIARVVARHAASGTLAPAPPPRWSSFDHRDEPTPGASPTLRYPSKVAVDGRGRIAVADAGHHRVLVGRLHDDGATLHVERVVGRGIATSAHAGYAAPGASRDELAARADGSATTATFESPQGLAFSAVDGAKTLFVADAGNHAVRAIDLATWHVRTLAGTGVRVRTDADRAHGALASPWDLVVVDRALVVAMAGTHTLWHVGLDDGVAHPSVGGRGEGLVDGAALDALLAQPMGVAASGRSVWSADAESSAIRVVADGAVRTLVGLGLFDFGDRDGAADDVRLQHPQSLAVAPDGRLLVADSYNDALKWLDPANRRVTTCVRGLHEPAGLAVDARRAYVVDTNVHRLVVVDLATGATRPLAITG